MAGGAIPAVMTTAAWACGVGMATNAAAPMADAMRRLRSVRLYCMVIALPAACSYWLRLRRGESVVPMFRDSALGVIRHILYLICCGICGMVSTLGNWVTVAWVGPPSPPYFLKRFKTGGFLLC